MAQDAAQRCTGCPHRVSGGSGLFHQHGRMWTGEKKKNQDPPLIALPILMRKWRKNEEKKEKQFTPAGVVLA